MSFSDVARKTSSKCGLFTEHTSVDVFLISVVGITSLSAQHGILFFSSNLEKGLWLWVTS